MAGDWIPMRMDLLDDPAVIAIGAAVGLDEYGVAGRLLKVWGWANRHLKDGHAVVPDKWVDDYVGTPGFAAAMLRAGWLRTRSSGGLEFTSFDRWNSNGAKVRLGETLRKRAYREKKPGPGRVPDVSRTKPRPGPGPEKRREEKREEENPPTPPAGGTRHPDPPEKGTNPKPEPAEAVPLPPDLDAPAFRSAWADWLADRKARGKRVTALAARQQLAALAPLGPDRAAACVRQSIEKGWTGLFPERFQAAPQQPPPGGPAAPGMTKRQQEVRAAIETAQKQAAAIEARHREAQQCPPRGTPIGSPTTAPSPGPGPTPPPP